MGSWLGCNPEKEQKKNESESGGSSARVSNVPLRISLVASIAQPETLVRQWSAISEQPIEIRSITVDELLSAEKCSADLLLYPSRLIGELIRRQWIAKLPAVLQELTKNDANKKDDENLFAAIPPAMVMAGMYSSITYGLPIGYSMVSLLANASSQAEKMSWELLSASLEKFQPGPLEFEEAQVDREALVDRFLTLAIAKSDVNGKYGVLFDIRTMKARLTAPEFVFAAETLLRLAGQPSALLSVIGSHSEAWKWINGAQEASLALASASQIDVDSLGLDNARLVVIDNAKPWNSGSGILASVAMDCRQSAQTTKFAYWLAQTKTLETIRGLVPGLLSAAQRGRSLADRVVSANSLSLQQDSAISEPRGAGTQQLRSELSNHLIEMLKGKASIQDSLSAAATRWNAIIKLSASNPKAEYERALGLKD